MQLQQNIHNKAVCKLYWDFRHSVIQRNDSLSQKCLRQDDKISPWQPDIGFVDNKVVIKNSN